MGRKRRRGDHHHPIRDMGCEPRPGSGLHVLRRRLRGCLRVASGRCSHLVMSWPADRDREALRYGKVLRRRFCTKVFTVASGGCLEETSAMYRHAVVDARLMSAAGPVSFQSNLPVTLKGVCLEKC